jgi:beta-galactosidase
VTTHAHGRGRVTYVGTLPDRALAVALARRLRPAEDLWAQRPETVTVTSARTAAGRRARFVANWSWDPAGLKVPVPVQDVLSGDEMGLGAPLDLGPWDIRVLLEEPGTPVDEEGRTP